MWANNRVRVKTTSTGSGNVHIGDIEDRFQGFDVDGVETWLLIEGESGSSVVRGLVFDATDHYIERLETILVVGWDTAPNGHADLPAGEKTVSVVSPAHALPRAGTNDRLALGRLADSGHDGAVMLGGASSLREASFGYGSADHQSHVFTVSVSDVAGSAGEVQFPTISIPLPSVSGLVAISVRGRFFAPSVWMTAQIDAEGAVLGAANTMDCASRQFFAYANLYEPATAGAAWTLDLGWETSAESPIEPPAGAEWHGLVEVRVLW